MNKSKTHLLELSTSSKEVMLMKITKKKFAELLKFGITRDEFDDLAGELEMHIIFSSSTHESGGYDVDLYLDGKSVSGFEQHLHSLLAAKQPDREPTVVLRSTKTNRTTYYIYWERFFKKNIYKRRIQGEFLLDKFTMFFPKDIQVGNQVLNGFECTYDGNDLDEDSINFGSDELYLIDSSGKRFDFDIHN
jgi:hypothetical protein